MIRCIAYLEILSGDANRAIQCLSGKVDVIDLKTVAGPNIGRSSINPRYFCPAFRRATPIDGALAGGAISEFAGVALRAPAHLSNRNPHALTMHQAAFPPVIRTLNALSAILDKAAAHCEARKIDPSVLLNYRLAPDMFALTSQIQVATDQAKGMAARLAGVEVPSYPDTESTIRRIEGAARQDRRITSRASRQSNSRKAKTREVTMKMRGGEQTFNGRDYAFGFVLAEFLFPRDHRIRHSPSCRPRTRQAGFYGRAIERHFGRTACAKTAVRRPPPCAVTWPSRCSGEYCRQRA